MAKTWKEKLEIDSQRKIVPIPERMRKRLGDGTLLIPRPLDVDAAIRKIPAGHVSTMGELRNGLARQFGATATCPLCAGMFLRIAAEAAEEAAPAGGDPETPYWRVVRDDGGMNPKLPGGAAGQARRLRGEGHAVSAGPKAKVKFLSR